MSVPYLDGASIDFEDTIQKQGFTIDNPNAAGSCACGDCSTESRSDTTVHDRASAGRRAPFVVIDSEANQRRVAREVIRCAATVHESSRKVTGALESSAPLGRASRSAVAVAIVLAGCTPAAAPRASCRATPGVTEPHRAASSASGSTSWIVLLAVGVIDLGPHDLGRGRLPPPQGPDRPPGAAALQPADRDLLHDRAAHPGARLLRLHRARPGRRSRRRRRTRRHDRGLSASTGRGTSTTSTRTSTRPGIQAQELDDADGSVDEDELPTLYLPVDKTVEINLESRDVIHSFWVIDFLYKKDMIPGKTNYMYFIPDRRGHVPGQVRRALRRVPLAACSSTSRSSREAEYDAVHPELCATPGHDGQLGPEYNTNTNLPGNGTAARRRGLRANEHRN